MKNLIINPSGSIYKCYDTYIDDKFIYTYVYVFIIILFILYQKGKFYYYNV